MFARLMMQNLMWTGVMGALLILSAGTLRWPAVWVFLAAMLLLGLGSGLYLIKVDPGLLEERMRPPMQRDQPFADKVFIAAFGVVATAWFVLCGLEYRVHRAAVGWPVHAVGLMLLIASTLSILWVMRANSFAAPVVRVQSERHHRVIDSGPYAWVRHPMYSGAALYFAGMPLALGSWWGLAFAPVLVAMFAYRTVIEEATLRDHLPGYSEYAARVRYRLVPGVW
jgi:protein-S-isoprenylcysteine O-methyltransferase Ste14